MVRQPNASERTERSASLSQLADVLPRLRRLLLGPAVGGLGDQLERLVPGMTLRQLELLRVLATRGPQAMHQLAEWHGTSRSSTTELVDRLAARGMVVRSHDEHDRRGVVVSLSPSATDYLEQLRGAHAALLGELLDQLDDRELEQLAHLLTKLSPAQRPLSPS